MHLAPILKEKGILQDEHLKYIEGQLSGGEQTEEELLLNMGVPAELIREALSTYYELPTREVKTTDVIGNDILQYIAEDSARHYKMVPLELRDGTLIVGVADPDMLGIRDALSFVTSNKGVPYALEVLLERDLGIALGFYDNIRGDVGEALVGIEGDTGSLEEEISKVGENELDALSEDAPVTKIVSTILRYAIDGRASDIHIEPHERLLVVRFRIDGILQRSLELPKRIHPAVIARIKVLSQLRLDEKRKPQDGRFSTHIHERKVDFRISILPTSYGEKAVMRILDTAQGTRRFDEIGMSPHVAKAIRHALKQPHGIILLSGPTGSGKTTSLYAMLQELDRESRNIISLEDPVEYNIDGVSQSQIRPEIGYTFANGLRSILRQDPDVIMVGEIRDKETAQLAVQAALTGHLVFSTIHTNSAIGVVTRLIDMGIDPYLIAPTLRLAVAQRLVQRLCPENAQKVPRTGPIAKMVDDEFADYPDEYIDRIPTTDHFLQAMPSDACPTGKKGRIAMFEAFEVNSAIQDVILSGAEESKMYDIARKRGYLTLKEDAIIHGLQHDISYDEIEIMSGEMLEDTEEETEAIPKTEPETPQEPTTSETPQP